MIGFLLSLVISMIQVARTVDTRAIFLGLDGLRIWIGIGVVAIVASVLFVVWRRPRIKTVGISLLLLVLVGFGGKKLVRIESFYGNMVPRLTWSWTPEQVEPFADYDLTRNVAVVRETPRSVRTTELDFTGFLGQGRDGVVDGVSLDDWTTSPPELMWRKPVGVGWAGFAVVGDLAFTQEQRGELETVVAYELDSGEEVWVHGDAIRFVDEHGDGPRAVPSFHDGRLYTIGATGLLNCLNASDGKLIWQQQALNDPDKNNLLWGMSGSPLIVDDVVVVTPGGGEGQAIKAFQVEDGTPVFEHGDDATAYASPSFVTLAGLPQYLCFNGAGLRGFSAAGEPLWLYPWITQGERQRVNVAQPIVVTVPDQVVDDTASHVLVSSGYGMGIALIRISTDDNGAWQAQEVWGSRQLKSKMSNFVVHDGYVYGFDNGIFTCVDLRDGRRVWKKGRYGHGQVLLVSDRLLVQTESGEVVLLSATPDGHKQLGTLAALSDKTWNHAALAGKMLIVRNDREAACFRLP